MPKPLASSVNIQFFLGPCMAAVNPAEPTRFQCLPGCSEAGMQARKAPSFCQIPYARFACYAPCAKAPCCPLDAEASYHSFGESNACAVCPQAVLSELLRSSAGMDFAAAQRQQRELEEVRHQRWQQQHQFNTGQQAHVVNEMDRNSCHREPASQVDSSEQCLEQKQQQQQQQQQQPQLASSSDISPRSKPLHAYMHSHGQLVQQQWQREQMLRNWRIHH